MKNDNKEEQIIQTESKKEFDPKKGRAEDIARMSRLMKKALGGKDDISEHIEQYIEKEKLTKTEKKDTESDTFEKDTFEPKNTTEPHITNETSEKQANKSETQTLSVSDLQKAVLTLSEKLKRNEAELVNFKKRTEEQRIKDMKFYTQHIMEEFISVLDTFQHALSLEVDEKTAEFLKGFQMIFSTLEKTLDKHGMKKIEVKTGDIFDTYKHSAIDHVASEIAENHIVQVMQHGYQLHDRILRPAMVTVSSGENKKK